MPKKTNIIISASIYSFLSEIIAKFISPFAFLILTHVLDPSDFGIVAIATTIVGFVNVISDLGISKIIIQEDTDKAEMQKICDVGFLFNVVLGGSLFIAIMLGSKQLAKMFCEEKSSTVIAVMSILVVINSISSVHFALRKKYLEFKYLFFLRVITVIVPNFIAIPLALIGYGYWAIVIGQIVGAAISTSILWAQSNWKPKISINMKILINVVKKSIWDTIEQLSIWILIILDTYLISKKLSANDLGLYVTSRALFTTATTLTLGAIMPIIYSTLAKLKKDETLMKESILLSQKIVFGIASLLGTFVYIFRNEVEKIFFSHKWHGIAPIIGVVFLIMGYEYFYSVILEGMRAKAKFKILAINTILCVIITIPIITIGIKYGLLVYVILRTLSLLLWYPIIFIYSKRYLNLTFLDCLKNSKALIVSLICLIITNTLFEKVVMNDSILIGSKILMTCICCIIIIIYEKDIFKIFKKQLIIINEVI